MLYFDIYIGGVYGIGMIVGENEVGSIEGVPASHSLSTKWSESPCCVVAVNEAVDLSLVKGHEARVNTTHVHKLKARRCI